MRRLVTVCGWLVETVKDHETGFLVEKNDCHALAEAILKLLENDALRERMGRAARKRVFEHFLWDGIVAALRDRYERLCQVNTGTGLPLERVYGTA